MNNDTVGEGLRDWCRRRLEMDCIALSYTRTERETVGKREREPGDEDGIAYEMDPSVEYGLEPKAQIKFFILFDDE